MVMEAFNDDNPHQDPAASNTGSSSSSSGGPPEIEWAIVGHSGDEAKLPLVDFGQPPRTRKVICALNAVDGVEGVESVHAHNLIDG